MPQVKKITISGGGVKRLQHLAQPPEALYVRGNSDILGLPSLTVVGTRKPTAYGLQVTRDLIAGLAGHDLSIVSGLAFGVDAAAHNAALAANLPTIAIQPGSVNTIYPRSNFGLAQQILQAGGAIVSEHPGDVPVRKDSFVVRNRIAAGLADTVLITEASIKSGTMHTVNFALELGVPVLAVPGPITSAASQGTNKLLSQGATPVLSTQDILDCLGLASSDKQTKLTFNTRQEATVYEALQQPLDIEQLARSTKLSASELQQALSMLELESAITCSAGTWQRTA